MVGVPHVLGALGTLLLAASALPLDKRAAEVVPGKYIVTLKPGTGNVATQSHLAWVADIHSRSLTKRDTTGVNKVFNIRDWRAYSGSFDEATIAQIKQNSEVLAVEQDKVWTINAPATLATEQNAPWGLGSISHVKPNFTDYVYDASAGAGTWAYIIDTGLNPAHVEFEGRAFLGYNAYPNSSFVDLQGHGTHTAGTVASRSYGVAKQAKVMSVKVFDDSGSTTEIVLDGYNWAYHNITSTPGRAAISVISMSLGGPQSDTFNAAVKAAFNDGVLSVVAAGNDGDDAKYRSPASAPEAITVAAVDVNDTRPWWSNTGSFVDVFAPGVGVLSTWIGSGNNETEVLDGTSMATPHVAGLVLYLKGLGLAGAGGGGAVAVGDDVVSPAGVTAKIKSLGTPGVVQDPGSGSVNLLAYNGNGL